MTWVRSVIGVAVGAFVAMVLYQIGAAVALVSIYGMPLGSPGVQPGVAYFVVNLTFAAAAGVAGGWLAAAIAGHSPTAHGVVLGIALATFVLWGFSRPSSSWPRWYAPVLALLGIASTIAGAALRRRTTT